MEVRVFFSVTVFIATAATITKTEQGRLNGYCTDSKSCGVFGYICTTNKTCRCNTWYIPDKSRGKCVGGVGQGCKYDEHCIEGAFCEHQSKCRCKENLFPYDGGLVCSTSSEKYCTSQYRAVGLYFASLVFTFVVT